MRAFEQNNPMNILGKVTKIFTILSLESHFLSCGVLCVGVALKRPIGKVTLLSREIDYHKANYALGTSKYFVVLKKVGFLNSFVIYFSTT